MSDGRPNYHVLVLAMSTLPSSVVSGKGETFYRLKRSGLLVEPTYRGLGQLEVLPLFVRHTYETDITHIIVLATQETRMPIDYVDANAQATCRELARLYDGRKLHMGDLKEISHLEFFRRRLAWEGLRPQFCDISIDVEDPAPGLEELLKKVRTLYAQCLQEDGDWNLWLDTHGGFREISMAMFGLMQMLAAPGEQELTTFASTEADANAIKRLNDGRDTIPITGVYSIEFDAERARKGECQAILDRTSFYRTFTKPAIEAYMNYGQYAQMMLRSDTRYVNGSISPYAFISYRRTDAPKERYTFLGNMKKLGLRYWYDDAIAMQQDWLQELRRACDECSVFVALISKNYFGSYQCVRELRQAIDGQKPIVLVSLDGTEIYAAKGGLCQRDTESQNTATISEDELAVLSAKQHIMLSNLVIDGVFQTSELERRLQELCAAGGAFATIREAMG